MSSLGFLPEDQKRAFTSIGGQAWNSTQSGKNYDLETSQPEIKLKSLLSLLLTYEFHFFEESLQSLLYNLFFLTDLI